MLSFRPAREVNLKSSSTSSCQGSGHSCSLRVESVLIRRVGLSIVVGGPRLTPSNAGLNVQRHWSRLGAPLAPGNEETRRALTDERRRPPTLRTNSRFALVAFGSLFLPLSAPAGRGSVGSSRLRVGIRRSTCVPGSWHPRFSQPATQATIGDWRWWRMPPSVSWRAAGHQHHDGFTFESHWSASRTVCRRQWLHEGGRSGDIRSCQGRKEWQVFRGMPPFLEPVVKKFKAWDESPLFQQRESRLAPPLGSDVGL